MKIAAKHILAATLMTATVGASAQYNVVVATEDGSNLSVPTTSVESVDISGNTVSLNPNAGSVKAKRISFSKQKGDGVNLIEARGWFESVYAKWELMDGATTYHVYVKGEGDYERVDQQLVRNYGSYGRVDVPGLAAGNYSLKVVPVVNGAEVEAKSATISGLQAVAYDRHGFAHFGATEGVGAYNDDGTLKQNARVVYVSASNAKTVTLDVVTGKNGKTTTQTGIQNIIYGYQKGLDSRPLDIRLIGKISKDDCDELLSSAEGLQVKGASGYQTMNITIEGIGDDATIHGFGLLLRNVASVELRNFAIMWFMDDGVSIDTKNERVWVHNLDIFYGQKGSDSDQAKGDGSFDLKGNSRLITCSYNRFWDSGKCSLCGMKSETAPNWITYHHNWFDHADSRMPRIRTMSVHVYNNYYDGVAKYGVGAAYQSNAFVEANYFRATAKPMLISMQGSDIKNNAKGTFSSEDGGMIKAWNNIFAEQPSSFSYIKYDAAAAPTQFDAYEVENRTDTVPSTVVALKGGRKYDNWDVDPTLMYHVTPDDPATIPSTLTGYLGAGRQNHGDIKYTITGDSNYDVDTALSDAVRDYQGTLVGQFGE